MLTILLLVETAAAPFWPEPYPWIKWDALLGHFDVYFEAGLEHDGGVVVNKLDSKPSTVTTRSIVGGMKVRKFIEGRGYKPYTLPSMTLPKLISCEKLNPGSVRGSPRTGWGC